MKNYRIIYRITDTEQSSLLSAAALKILQELKLIFGIILPMDIHGKAAKC